MLVPNAVDTLLKICESITIINDFSHYLIWYVLPISTISNLDLGQSPRLEHPRQHLNHILWIVHIVAEVTN